MTFRTIPLLGLFVAILLSSPAAGDVFDLAPVFSANYADTGMITWVSPFNGIVNISGNAWATNHTSLVTLEYVPAAIAATVNNPGNGIDGALEAGTTPLLGGAAQYPYSTSQNPAAFGTSPYIPCSASASWCNYTYMGPLQPIAVNQGDMIAAVIQNMYMYSGDVVGLNLSVTGSGNAQGSAGTTLANPTVLGSISGGIDGSLDPSSGHSSDTYEFYWNGGDLGGTATTNASYTFGANPSVSGGFAAGLRLALFYFPSDSLVGTPLTVLDNSATSGVFDFGALPAGNYLLQVSDASSASDPPYDIAFNGSIDPPSPGSPVPEPRSILLCAAMLGGLVVPLARHRQRR